MKWIVVLLVILLYVHLFNHIARLYLNSEKAMTWGDLYRRFFPGVKISIEF